MDTRFSSSIPLNWGRDQLIGASGKFYGWESLLSISLSRRFIRIDSHLMIYRMHHLWR